MILIDLFARPLVFVRDYMTEITSFDASKLQLTMSSMYLSGSPMHMTMLPSINAEYKQIGIPG